MEDLNVLIDENPQQQLHEASFTDITSDKRNIANRVSLEANSTAKQSVEKLVVDNEEEFSPVKSPRKNKSKRPPIAMMLSTKKYL